MESHINMNEPLISFVSPAVRSYRYKPYCDSLLPTDVPFEVIFLGPNPPTEKMPDNFQYIKTDIKPGQCYEAGVRMSKGQYIHVLADDFTYPTNYLKNLSRYISILDTDRILITVRIRHVDGKSEVNKKHIDHGCVFDAHALNAPFSGCAPLFKKDIWMKLGGFDRRFHGSLPDMDLQQRCYEYGMNPFMAPDCLIEEHNFYDVEDKSESLLTRTGQDAGETLRSFWMKDDGTVSKTRLLPVQSYEDKDILVKDQ